jgi:RHH-type rel operon transcriptional repressor/antitoxin RelB
LAFSSASDFSNSSEFAFSELASSKAFYLREIIEAGLSDMEDYYFAINTLERVRKGEEAVYSLDEVEKSLGLDD